MTEKEKIEGCFLDACKDGKVELALNVLDNHGVDINCIDRLGNSALIGAASRGRTEIIDFLIKRGINIDFQGSKGITAIMASVVFQKNDVFKLLIENKANVNLVNNEGITPLIKAILEHNYCAINLLIKNYDDLNFKTKLNSITTDGDTALSVAICTKQNDIVKLLLDAGANIELIDTKTALDIAYECENYVAMILMKKELINKQDILGNTLLIKSCQNKHEEGILFFHENGADFFIKNDNDVSAFDLLNQWEDIPEELHALKEKVALEHLVDIELESNFGM